MTVPDPAVRIACLGELRIELGGRDVTAELPGRQGRALVAYLVLNAPRPVSRDELLAVLWPTAPPAAPDAAFSSVLAKVRRTIGADLLPGRATLTLQLPPGAYVDVHKVAQAVEDAERALSGGDAASALDTAQDAVGIAGRPLLPQLQGDWVEVARARVHDHEVRAREALARAALALGGHHLATAERAAAAVAERERFREGGYALLMEAQARRGNSAEAMRTYERLRVLLRDELGIAPSQELVDLHDRLLRGKVPRPDPRTRGTDDARAGAVPAPARPAPAAVPVPAVTPRTSEGAFVGREACLERLAARWRDSRAGHTSVVLLVGEAGIGKTRLATRFAEEAHRDAGAVLYGRTDAEALLPYQPFAEALQHLTAHMGTTRMAEMRRELEILGRLFPRLGADTPPGTTIDQQTLRYELFEAVVSILTRASADWPVLLVLDDLHWADKPTLLLVRHVIRHAEGARLLIVGTFRHVDVGPDHPLNDLLADLRRERRFDRLQLDGLDERATHALIADRLAAEVTPQFVRRLHEQTDGNAFFIEETVRALGDARIAENAVVGDDALDRLGVPEGIAEVITRRLRQLSPLACELLTAASVVGRSFPLAIVEHLVDASADDVFAAIEESIAAGLVLEAADAVDVCTFSHALVREVLYAQLTAMRRVRLHHRVAQALERISAREPVNPAELAHHFGLARHLAGPEPARRYALAAARRAADLFAYEEAAEHLRRAIELYGDSDDDGERCEALLALGRVEWHAGDDAARQTFLAAAASAERRRDADQLARAALGLGERYFEVTYLGARYRELLEKALAGLGPDDSPRRALLLARLAANLAFPNEDERAHALAADAVAMARRLGDVQLLGAVLLARHVTLLDVRHIEERLALSDELGALGAGHPELAAELHHWRMYDLLGVDAVDAAAREHAQLEDLARTLGQPLLRSLAAGARGLWAELSGDVDLAERCAEESLQQARVAHTQDAVSSWASQVFASRRRQSRLGDLAPYVERLAASGGHQLGWLSALGVLRFETGDAEGGRRIYEQELGAGPGALPRGMFWLTRIALLSELCAKVGDVDGARALYAELAPHADRNVVVAYCSFWGPVDGYLALLAQTFGDAALAAEHARSALTRTRRIGAPLLTHDLEQRHGALLVAS